MVFFRADANEVIGTGHVMRCISIAKAFAHRGIEALFIVADERSKVLIEQNGFGTICLNSEWTNMESELPKIREIICECNPNLLVVDSYYVTERYFSSLARECKIAYIDDMNQERFDIDILINYNIFAQSYDYSWYIGTHTKLLLHPKYAPLREEFRDCPRHRIKKTSDVLVSAGGADPEHVTERMISEICEKMIGVRFHFVIGALNSRIVSIEEMAKEKGNVILHINEKYMAHLMKNCDIAISAAGTTLYELCATGIPTITYSLADNQLVAAEQFDKQGIMLSVGDCRGNVGFINQIAFSLGYLIENENKRKELSKRMQDLVDGQGAARIVEKLIDYCSIKSA